MEAISRSEPEARQTTNQSAWLRLARSQVRRVRFGWWLASWNGMFLGTAVFLAAVILIARTVNRQALSGIFSGPAGLYHACLCGGVILAMILAALIRSRRHALSTEDGLHDLDRRLGLHNRLGSASAGVGSWPSFAPVTRERLGWNWRWSAVLAPTLAGLISLVFALLLPLPAVLEEPAPLPPQGPAALEKMEEWLETLSEEQIVEEPKIEELAKKIDQLQQQDPEEWFSHASLEATDNLEESLGKDIREMARNLDALERSLADLASLGPQENPDARAESLQAIEQALEALSQQGLPLDESMMKQLGKTPGIDPAQLARNLAGLSKEQMQSLREKLGKGSQALGSLEGLPSLEDDPSIGEGQICTGEGIGTMPGQGGVQRGPGTAPITFGDPKDLGTTLAERLTNDDLSRATPAELLALGLTEHDKDPTVLGSHTGGSTATTGSGGEAVWKEGGLLPEEKALLKRWFHTAE
jgi:hypothetical protein